MSDSLGLLSDGCRMWLNGLGYVSDVIRKGSDISVHFYSPVQSVLLLYSRLAPGFSMEPQRKISTWIDGFESRSRAVYVQRCTVAS